MVKGPVETTMTDAVEKIAPGVIERQSVDEPVQTGLKSIDSMVPSAVASESYYW